MYRAVRAGAGVANYRASAFDVEAVHALRLCLPKMFGSHLHALSHMSGVPISVMRWGLSPFCLTDSHDSACYVLGDSRRAHSPRTLLDQFILCH